MMATRICQQSSRSTASRIADDSDRLLVGGADSGLVSFCLRLRVLDGELCALAESSSA